MSSFCARATWLLAATSALTKAAIVTLSTQAEQSIISFGASGAWWPNDLILFPETSQTNLSRLLFSSDGLQLSSYRYNMGGGGGADAKVVTTWESTVESFLKTNGTYDWSRDHAGVSFLKQAQAYNVSYITFFVNAAPSAIAANHAACGYSLATDAVPAFSTYIETVLSYWSDQGINISYVSPMNEPDNNRSDCGQEGMSVNPNVRPTLFQSLRSTLDASSAAKHVGIIGDETSQLVQATNEYSTWLPSSAPNLVNIAVHNYDYANDANVTAYYEMAQNLTDGNTPPIKFTETCCSTNSGSGSGVFGAQYDPTMANALIVARYVWQYMTLAQAVSFDWWTAVTYLPCSPTLNGSQCATSINETDGYNSGLIYIDPMYNQTQDYTLYLTKRYWALRHFSLFILPGSVRHDADTSQLPTGVETMITRGPQGVWTATFLSNSTSSQPVSLQLPPGASSPCIENFVVTDPVNDWQVLDGTIGSGLVSYNGWCLDLNLSAQSITSMRWRMDLTFES